MIDEHDLCCGYDGALKMRLDCGENACGACVYEATGKAKSCDCASPFGVSQSAKEKTTETEMIGCASSELWQLVRPMRKPRLMNPQ